MSTKSRIRVERYEPRHKTRWDTFVRKSKNGVFLFYRDYLEYHADRFNDFSLLFFQNDQLIALMPANRTGSEVISHGGLTFGGIITGAAMTTALMLETFNALVQELSAIGINKLVYKAVPHIYHTLPAEEDLYALFVHNAKLFRRDVSSAFLAGRRFPMNRNRKRSLEHAHCQGLKLRRSRDFSHFMAIVEANLQARYGTRPVHSVAEMELLASRFPENIKLFAAERDSELLGGVIIYETETVAHAQYRHATPGGEILGAPDFIMDALLNDVYRDKPYFDFGISTVDNGRSLNHGLIQNKESFGARATVYDFYELNLAS
jgi:hypothetical protein